MIMYSIGIVSVYYLCIYTGKGQHRRQDMITQSNLCMSFSGVAVFTPQCPVLHMYPGNLVDSLYANGNKQYNLSTYFKNVRKLFPKMLQRFGYRFACDLIKIHPVRTHQMRCKVNKTVVLAAPNSACTTSQGQLRHCLCRSLIILSICFYFQSGGSHCQGNHELLYCRTHIYNF